MPASNRGTVRRTSLLAGGSLLAATIILAAGLAPTAARAANECVPIGVDPSVNGATADTYACAGSATYTTTGITYASAGNLTVNSTGAMNVGTVGINLTGAGADSVTFTSTGALTGTGGPVLDVTSVSGPISLTTAGVTGTNIAATYGIQAVSTGGGAIIISNATGAVNVSSTTAGALQQSAIRAISTGGNGAVTITTGSAVTGRVRGIEAQASGTGALTITATNTVTTPFPAANQPIVSVAAIDARTGTGLLTINVNTGSGNISGSGGAAILTNAGGSQVINIAAGRSVTGQGEIDSVLGNSPVLNLTAVGSTTVTNAGTLSASTSFLGDADGMVVRAAGGSFSLTNSNALVGRVDLSGITGAATITNSAGSWRTSGLSTFGPGTSTVTNVSPLVLNGLQTTFSGLDVLNNSGTISFGFSHDTATEAFLAPGAAFNASGSSVLQMDVRLSGGGQGGCGLAGISDCFGLQGGSTSGVTTISLTVLGLTAANAGYTDPIALIDVAGGVSHAGDFVLATTSTNYANNPVFGPSIVAPGLVSYAFGYDADRRQHVLTAIPNADAFQFMPIVREALSVWHTTTDAVVGRQADLRAGAVGGAWARAVGDNTQQDIGSFTGSGATFTFTGGYSQTTAAAIVGFDIAGGEDFVIGAHAGYVSSKVDVETWTADDKMAGATVGLYAGWWRGGLTLDGALNANLLTLDRRSALEDLSSNIVSLGGRLEAGWRMPVGEALYVQPLVTAAYARGDIEALTPAGYEIAYEDVRSLRAAVGLRVGKDAPVEGGTVGYWVVARAWQEFAEDATVLVGGPGSTTTLALADDLSGALQEVGFGLSLSDRTNTLSGFLSGGAKFAEDSDSYSLSVGARLRW